MPVMLDRAFSGGLIRLHILHHACHEPIFGQGIMEELARHGYKLSAGTLYPILHGLETAGYLVSNQELTNGRKRRVYLATETGKLALTQAKDQVRELFRELFEEHQH
jgi:DNA-binding PadR family transcriptional regulator